jgi:hypothetical protein
MKRCICIFFVTVTNVCSFCCFSQQSNQNVSDDSQDLAIAYYHVEERINKNFGGSITTYNVPSLDMINSNNLGENNVRIITPKYVNAKSRKKIASNAKETIQTEISIPKSDEVSLINEETIMTSKEVDFVNIDVVGTYERIMEKGYRSIPMLIKVADRHFFAGKLVLAEKWYSLLFNETTELEPIYFYRYAESLKAINNVEKSNEMMKLYESKNK